MCKKSKKSESIYTSLVLLLCVQRATQMTMRIITVVQCFTAARVCFCRLSLEKLSLLTSSTQIAEGPTMMEQMLLSDPILPEKRHQVLPHSLLVRCSDNSEALVTGCSGDPPPMSLDVMRLPFLDLHRTFAFCEHLLLKPFRTVASSASAPTGLRGWRGCASVGLREMAYNETDANAPSTSSQRSASFV